MRLLCLCAALPAFWLASCAGGGSSTGAAGAAASTTADAASPTAEAGYRMKSGDRGDNDENMIAKKWGTRQTFMTGEGDTRKMATGYDRNNAQFARSFQDKKFDTSSYQKKSLWAEKDYEKKVYGGDTDGSRFRKSSGFGEKSAREGGLAARDAGRQFATGSYETSAAREGGGKRLPVESNPISDYRRKVGNAFSAEEPVDWKSQRAITIDETRRMLGR